MVCLCVQSVISYPYAESNIVTEKYDGRSFLEGVKGIEENEKYQVDNSVRVVTATCDFGCVSGNDCD